MKNKIDGNDRSIADLLRNKKFFIDYFQREYRWEEKHIQALIDDLTSTFLAYYEKGHERTSVQKYPMYYLGPIVLCEEEDGKSIIDGQQRITSLTLLLIYLKHKMRENIEVDSSYINNLIFSENYGEKSYNLNDKDREACLESLYKTGTYETRTEDNETVNNIVDRYNDIDSSFGNIDQKAMPYFTDWLINNVTVIEITAYTKKNVYMIFETMNDRGLNLTPSEMLKGFILSKIEDEEKRKEADKLWKDKMQALHQLSKDADGKFFQAWFRGKYAEKIRESKKGSVNQDFEEITQFHRWFRDNCEKKMSLKTSDEFYDFLKKQFTFFIKWYIKIKQEHAQEDFVYYIRHYGIAESLQDALLLSVINREDDDAENIKKLNNVGKFIETFKIRREINHKRYGASGIRNTFFGYIKDWRNLNTQELNEKLQEKYLDPDSSVQWNNIPAFQLNSQNKKFVKHFLSRVTSYIESLANKTSRYSQYHHPSKEKVYEIEHIIGNNEQNKRQFGEDFENYRNQLGALALWQKGTNQSNTNHPYDEKRKNYIKENYWLSSLCDEHYKNNPNFTNQKEIKNLRFKPHKNFLQRDVKERNDLLKQICEKIWNNEYRI